MRNSLDCKRKDRMENDQITSNPWHLTDNVLRGVAQVSEKYPDFNEEWLISAKAYERWLKLAD